MTEFRGGPNDGAFIDCCPLLGEYIWTDGNPDHVCICHGDYTSKLPCYKGKNGFYQFVGYTPRGKIEDECCDGR